MAWWRPHLGISRGPGHARALQQRAVTVAKNGLKKAQKQVVVKSPCVYVSTQAHEPYLWATSMSGIIRVYGSGYMANLKGGRSLNSDPLELRIRIEFGSEDHAMTVHRYGHHTLSCAP